MRLKPLHFLAIAVLCAICFISTPSSAILSKSSNAFQSESPPLNFTITSVNKGASIYARVIALSKKPLFFLSVIFVSTGYYVNQGGLRGFNDSLSYPQTWNITVNNMTSSFITTATWAVLGSAIYDGTGDYAFMIGCGLFGTLLTVDNANMFHESFFGVGLMVGAAAFLSYITYLFSMGLKDGIAAIDVDALKNRLQRVIGRRPNAEQLRLIEEANRAFKKNILDTMTRLLGEKYLEPMNEMVAENSDTIVIAYDDLPALHVAEDTLNCYHEINLATQQVVTNAFPHYENTELFVQIEGFPTTNDIITLENVQNAMVKIQGFVTSTTGLLSQFTVTRFECPHCGTSMGPIAGTAGTNVKPVACEKCGHQGSFESMEHESHTYNYRRISVTTTDHLTEDRVTHTVDVIVPDRTGFVCHPGNQIEVTGCYNNIYNAGKEAKRFPMTKAVIGNFFHLLKDAQDDVFSDNAVKAIQQLAADPDVYRKIIATVAPEVEGCYHVKEAVALSLFCKNSGSRVKGEARNTVNILIIGTNDAISETVQTAARLTSPSMRFQPRLPEVGLTISMRRHAETNELILEAGAMVSARQGYCFVENLQKLNNQDQMYLNSAMQSGMLQVSKSGIKAAVATPCSIIATGNIPTDDGSYDSTLPHYQNLKLPMSTVSSFDIILVTGSTEGDIDGSPVTSVNVSLLKTYIKYARNHCQPQMDERHRKLIEFAFGQLQRESQLLNITPPSDFFVASTTRVAEAHARMYLRSRITDTDVKTAVRFTSETYLASLAVSTQEKESVMKKVLSNDGNVHQLCIILEEMFNKEASRSNMDVKSMKNLVISEKDFEAEAAKSEMTIEKM
uniref:MCM domain-containing protein n=1 Tax=Panagrellus redivivus TaxID=6233 RepID=A0A7E4UQG6_PANRE